MSRNSPLKLPKSGLGEENKLIYKNIKHQVLRLFGKKEGELYKEARGLILQGKPSALAKRLTEKLCKCSKPLQCCVAEVVTGMWHEQLPSQVRANIAGRSLKDDYVGTLQQADDVFASLSNSQQVAVVTQASAPTPPAPASSGDEEVAALRARGGGAGRGRWNRRGQRGSRGFSNFRGQGRGQSRGGGGGGYQQQQGHQDPMQGLPDDACQQHKKWGRRAYFCSDPDTCSWRNNCAPPKDKPKPAN